MSFSINRDAKSCHTPRRNTEIEGALSYFRSFSSWTQSGLYEVGSLIDSLVYNYFTNSLFPVQKNHGLDLSKIADGGIFVPVVPLFEEQKGALAIEDGKGKDKSDSSQYGLVTITAVGDKEVPILPPEDVTCFLKEQGNGYHSPFNFFKCAVWKSDSRNLTRCSPTMESSLLW